LGLNFGGKGEAMRSKKTKAVTLTVFLRKIINDRGESLHKIAKETGLDRHSLRRFARGQQTLRLDRADALCEFFGIVHGGTGEVSLTTLLRNTLLMDDASVGQIAKCAGLQPSALCQFSEGLRSMLLDRADLLCEYFGIAHKRKGR